VGARLAATAIVLILAAACAAPRLALPTGAGTPLPDFEPPLAEATAGCAAVRTLTSELRLSGRVAGRAVRGRALVGLAAPDELRLEGLAPFGPPAFILTARDGRATLFLPRDNRVLRESSPAEVLEALSGAALSPADLLAVLAGCGAARRTPTRGSAFGDWVVIDLDGGARLFLRRQPTAWTVMAALWDTWRVEYPERTGRFPGRVRLQSTDASGPVDLDLVVSGVEANVEIGPEAFEVNVPPDAAPLSLDELRASGPLRDEAGESRP
jgi:hypothetical protein